MKKISALFFAAIILVCSVTSSFADQNYTKANGLVSDVVTAVFMDPSGSIWIGTDNGVSRFNGLEWIPYRRTNSTLPSDYINCIINDIDGNIYFGTPAGIARFDSPTWESLSLNLSGVGVDVETMILDTSGDIWLGTDGGLAKFSNEKISKTYTMADSAIPNNFVKQITIDTFDNLWLATGGGVSKFDGINFTNSSTSQGLPDNNIKSIVAEDGSPDPDSDIIWAATVNGVGKQQNDIWSTVTTFDGLPENNVNYLLVDYQFDKWFATATKGLAKLSGVNTWTYYDVLTGNLVDDNCNTLGLDNSGNVWVGTQGGVTRIGDNPIVSFSKILYLNIDTLAFVTVNDTAANTDPNTAETLTVKVVSDTDGTGINLILRETGLDTGIFSSNTSGEDLGFTYAASDEPNRLILVNKGDSIIVRYTDTTATNRLATAYYSEEVPFDDGLLIDSPCFIATASYDDAVTPGLFNRFITYILSFAE